MATYQFRTYTSDGGTRVQRTTVSANGTRSNTRTFYPGQRGYARNAALARRAGNGGTVSAAGDK